MKCLGNETSPSDDERNPLRSLKPATKNFRCCSEPHLHGNGWRRRPIVRAWWSRSHAVLWYWRLECVRCGKVHNVFFDFCIPGLLYAFDIVIDVVIGLLRGTTATGRNPDRRTRLRWLGRLRTWWAPAVELEMIDHPLNDWRPAPLSFRRILSRCLCSGVDLFASQNPLLEKDASPTIPAR